MRTGMLGDSEVLRRLWGGPFLDLAVKLNGEEGPEWERELKELLRRGPQAQTPTVQSIRPSTVSSFEISRLDTAVFMEGTAKYYNDRWKLHEFDPGNIVLPPYRRDFGWGLIVPPASAGITAQRAYEKLGERFAVWKYTNSSLDEAIDLTKEARLPGETGYAIWCRPVVEADDCHKNKSANAIAKARINPMSLLERLLLGDFVLYLGWVNHLDEENITLCAGSRDSCGDVPGVNWRRGDRRLCVDWCRPGDASGGLRVREVVSAAATAAA